MAPRASAAKKLSADQQSAPNDHNEKAIEEGMRVQFLSFIGRLQQQKKKVDIAKAAAKVETDAMTEIFRYAKAAKFQRKDLQDMLDMMSSETRDVINEEKTRRKYMTWLGIITAETLDMFADGQPAEVLDEAHWSGMGYAAGLRKDECKVPDGCPQRFVGTFTDNWHRGDAVRKEGEHQALLAIVPGREKLKQAPKPKAVPEAIN